MLARCFNSYSTSKSALKALLTYWYLFTKCSPCLIASRRQSVCLKLRSALYYLTSPPISSFFQGLCVLGYCIAPLDIAALISCFVRVIYVRAPVALLAWAWCIWGGNILPSLWYVLKLKWILSIREFFRWHQNWAAKDFACRLSSAVGFFRSTRFFQRLRTCIIGFSTSC